ncbi:MAG: SDR family NAD(P)-dependent oxidoreductase [Candidatus Nanopelagicales bacterium]
MSEEVPKADGGLSRFDVSGKVVVVTGGGRGIGQGIAVAFAAAGAQVILVSRTEAELVETAEMASAVGPRAHTAVADLTDLDGLVGLADRLWACQGRVDVALQVAGRQLRKASVDVTPDELRAMLDLNLAAPFLLSAALGRRMIEDGIRGRHIFIGSLASRIGLPNVVPYAATKSGILGVVRGLAREWAPHGMTVNAVLPGYFDTALTRDLLSDPARSDWVMSRIPMGHLGDPDDVASACMFFASDASKYVTGEALAVDGGWLAS